MYSHQWRPIMKNRRQILCSLICLSFLAVAGSLVAQTTAAANPLAGRWEGNIIAARGTFEVPVFVDFTPEPEGRWRGTITLPLQSMTDYPKDRPLKSVTFDGSQVSFVHVMNEKQELLFQGALSPDRLSI